jgi:hypothetical protein
MPTETPDLDELRQMARRPQHYSTYTLAGALHQALDRLEAAEREREVLCYETGHAIKAALDVAHDDCVRAEQAEQRAVAAERERDDLRVALRQAEFERDSILRCGVPRAAPDFLGDR